MRKNNRSITIRMNEKDYNQLQRKATDSGLTIQSFGAQALQKCTVQSSLTFETESTLAEISRTFSVFESDLRQIAGDLKRTLKIQNTTEAYHNLVPILGELSRCLREGDALWQSIRSLTSPQNCIKQ